MLPLCTQHPETSATLATVDLDPGRLDQSRLIDKPYCGDGISVSPKRGRYYDFERQAEGTYKVDGVHADCFEKAGATYQFENGSFRQIVDSD